MKTKKPLLEHYSYKDFKMVYEFISFCVKIRDGQMAAKIGQLIMSWQLTIRCSNRFIWSCTRLDERNEFDWFYAYFNSKNCSKQCETKFIHNFIRTHTALHKNIILLKLNTNKIQELYFKDRKLPITVLKRSFQNRIWNFINGTSSESIQKLNLESYQ